MAASRHLAAILFTDISGFTELSRADEPRALALLDEQAGLLGPLFLRFHGESVKSTGDGFLVVFSSAREAVECAVEVQQAVARRNESHGALPLHIRIGIHLGDVEARGAEVFGDTVNVAARILGATPPGEITVSEPVFEQVQHRLPVNVERLGLRTVKGIQEPLMLYRVASPSGTPVPPMTPSSVPRIAVLPLSNISHDAQNEYFADGLTEELISRLSLLHGLRVIARTSVLRYKGTEKSVAQIGHELGVSTLLEGSVRKEDGRVRITVQLIDARTEEHRWTQTYDRNLESLFEVQSEVAEATARALQVKLFGGERAALQRIPTQDLEAYDQYLRGLVASREFSLESNARAIQCFEEAVRLDPKFGLACAWLASAYVAGVGDFYSVASVRSRLDELVHRALQLCPEEAEAHSAAGNFAMQLDQDWERADAEFRRAIELNPSSASALGWYGVLLDTLQRYEEAHHVFQSAAELDPHWILPRLREVSYYSARGRGAEAIGLAEKLVHDFPTLAASRVYAGECFFQAGDRERAEREADIILKTTPTTQSDATYLLWLLGRHGEVRTIMQNELARLQGQHVSALRLALVLAGLGDKERALDILEKDVRGGDRALWYGYQAVRFDSIRDDPRFVALLRELRLPLDRPPRPPKYA